MSQTAYAEQQHSNLVRLAHEHFATRVLELGHQLLMRLDERLKHTVPSLCRVDGFNRFRLATPSEFSNETQYDATYDIAAEHQVLEEPTMLRLVFSFSSSVLDAGLLRTSHRTALTLEDPASGDKLMLFEYLATGQGVKGHALPLHNGHTEAIDESLGAALQEVDVAEMAQRIAARRGKRLASD